MDFWNFYYHGMDLWLTPIMQLPQAPILGFYLGVAVLAAVCVVLGDFTYNLVVRADLAKIKETSAETTKYNNLSIEALQAGDGDSYHACNKMANEAFGRMFFLQLALSMASLWPLPFALAWLQYRFHSVEFPLALVSFTLGYTGVFIPIYVLARIGYGQIRPKLPFFRGAVRIFSEIGAQATRRKSWRDLLPAPPQPAE